MANDVPVLIAGGGLVGLSAAAFLAQQGVQCAVIEKLGASSPLPRAAFFHMRTLELFRALGVETQVLQGSARDFVPDGAIIAMDCLAGRKLGDIIANLNAGVDALSPCRRVFLNQPNLEPILRDRARSLGATILQGIEISGMNQDASGVRLMVREGAAIRELRSDYLLAADGGHSHVRDSLGIDFEGRGAFSHSVTIYFTADLRRYVGDNAWSIIYVNNATLRGFFRLNRAATSGFLAVNIVGDPAVDPAAAVNAAADVSETRLIALLRAAVGDPDLPVHIDGCSRWRATACVAQRFQAGRVFIVGDAAHLMPPTGGFGGNTGIHDAHNIAWKLAHVLRGHADPALLDSYESERLPVCRFTVEQAFARYVARTAPWLAAGTQPAPLVDDFQIELGTLYDSAGPPHADPHTTHGRPGSRLPHLWLIRGGARVSTIDLTGEYLLLSGKTGAAWIEAADALRPVLRGMPLAALQAGKDFEDTEQQFAPALGITDNGAILVRPDGYVAWRSVHAEGDTLGPLRAALDVSLGFTTGRQS
ncbi:MAG: FAD-dependent monooxygenase [Pseudomonadota bacterium]